MGCWRMESASIFVRLIFAIVVGASGIIPHGVIASTIMVLYPDAPDPYRQAFEQIINGLAETVGTSLDRRMVTTVTTSTQIQSWLDAIQTGTVVVILGRSTDSLAQIGHERLGRYRVFVSGINALPQQVSWPGVSLIADPTLYLQTLRALSPGIRQVTVFHHVRDLAWASRTIQAASNLGFSVEMIAVEDASSAAHKMGEALKTLDPQTTALWFAANTIDLDRELILPWILEQTWDRHIVAFSDTAAHTQRGFLFALYPDYTAIGSELGRRIRQGSVGHDGDFTLTQTVGFALNHRTARHLKIPLSKDWIQRAHPLYPLP